MEKLSKTAKILSLILNLLCWVILLGSLLYAFATARGYFNLAAHGETGIPTVNGITLDYMEFYSTNGITVTREAMMSVMLVSLCTYLLEVPLLCWGIQLLRKVLRPLVERRPFSGTAGILKRMGWVSLLIALVSNILDWALVYYIDHGYRLSELFLGSSITHIQFHFQLDSTFLIVAAVVFILSGVFHYGEELQQLSDETL